MLKCTATKNSKITGKHNIFWSNRNTVSAFQQHEKNNDIQLIMQPKSKEQNTQYWCENKKKCFMNEWKVNELMKRSKNKSPNRVKNTFEQTTND